MLNFEDVEERDGERAILCLGLLSNKIQNRRSFVMECLAVVAHRGDQDCCPHLGPLHTSKSP